MKTRQDQVRATRLGAFIVSVGDGEAFSEVDALAQAALWMKGEAESAREALGAALHSHAAEAVQETEAVAVVDQAIATAIDEYAALARGIRYHWIPGRRADKDALGESVLARRTEWISQHLSLPPSKVAEFGRQATHTHLASVLRAVETPDVADSFASMPLNVASFAEAVSALGEAVANLRRERLDDAVVFQSLVDARARAHSVYVSGRALLASFLRVTDSPLTPRDFMLREVSRRSPEILVEVTESLEEDEDDDAATSASERPEVPLTS